MNCNRAIRCWDNSVRYCVRPMGHAVGCNPFSKTAPTIGDQKEKREKHQDRIEVIYHKALEAAELSTAN